MKKTITLAIIAASGIGLLILNSFSGNANFQNSLASRLIGEWRNVYVKIIINNNGKSSSIEADSSNWEQKLDIKPIRNHFKSDGTYYSEYINLKDSVIKRPTGSWFVKGDTLTMSQITPSKTLLKMHVSVTNDHATFHGMVDFNGDGKTDDEYFGVQKKFAN